METLFLMILEKSQILPNVCFVWNPNLLSADFLFEYLSALFSMNSNKALKKRISLPDPFAWTFKGKHSSSLQYSGEKEMISYLRQKYVDSFTLNSFSWRLIKTIFELDLSSLWNYLFFLKNWEFCSNPTSWREGSRIGWRLVRLGQSWLGSSFKYLVSIFTAWMFFVPHETKRDSHQKYVDFWRELWSYSSLRTKILQEIQAKIPQDQTKTWFCWRNNQKEDQATNWSYSKRLAVKLNEKNFIRYKSLHKDWETKKGKLPR